jgi:hypothetical protein
MAGGDRLEPGARVGERVIVVVMADRLQATRGRPVQGMT